MKQWNFLFYGQKDGLNGSSLHKSDWTVMSFYISMTNNFCYSFRFLDDHNMFGFFYIIILKLTGPPSDLALIRRGLNILHS